MDKLVLGLTALCTAQALAAAPALAADCSQGSADEKVVCLNQKVVDLEAKLAELTKDTLKWNDRIALINEDMDLLSRQSGPKLTRRRRRARQRLHPDAGPIVDGPQALSVTNPRHTGESQYPEFIITGVGFPGIPACAGMTAVEATKRRWRTSGSAEPALARRFIFAQRWARTPHNQEMPP